MQWLKKNAVTLAFAGLLLVQLAMNRAWQIILPATRHAPAGANRTDRSAEPKFGGEAHSFQLAARARRNRVHEHDPARRLVRG